MKEGEVQTVAISPDLKTIRQYRWESHIAFWKFQKEIGNHYKSYFEELPKSDGGVYILKRKFNPLT